MLFHIQARGEQYLAVTIRYARKSQDNFVSLTIWIYQIVFLKSVFIK